jgi:IclR family transcriptional regulator, pca regulon regulatory protein
MVTRDEDRSRRSTREVDDFVAAIGRGFDVIKAFGPSNPVMTGSQIAAMTGISRPTVRRLLMTLEQLGYAAKTDDGYTLTVRTLELGTACVSALDEWELARPHLVRLVARTGESSSIAQLDGSDIVYRERVAVPKVIAPRVRIGSRFPATATSLGRVLLAALSDDALHATLAIPSRSRIIPRVSPTLRELTDSLASVRERGWSVSDQLLSFGVRSIAAPVRGADGTVTAAINIAVHPAETSLDTLINAHLPLLLEAAAAITQEWSGLSLLPFAELPTA